MPYFVLNLTRSLLPVISSDKTFTGMLPAYLYLFPFLYGMLMYGSARINLFRTGPEIIGSTGYFIHHYLHREDVYPGLYIPI
ncbi:MAG: hypothetical protein LUG18_03485 [Candidatus Azobacteroides sp.]|nr:hypothetical protein [Candidatus Azobacteroides sp.]